MLKKGASAKMEKSGTQMEEFELEQQKQKQMMEHELLIMQQTLRMLQIIPADKQSPSAGDGAGPWASASPLHAQPDITSPAQDPSTTTIKGKLFTFW